MSQILCSKPLQDNVKAIIQNHITELSQFITTPSLEITILDDVLSDLSHLQYFCKYTNEPPHQETYLIVSQSLNRVRRLFDVIGYTPDATSECKSELESLWKYANEWWENASSHFELSMEEVWNLIAPAVPDVLQQTSFNVYEARWWTPIPPMEYEILLRTEYVIIEELPFVPADMPGCKAVLFSIDYPSILVHQV